MGESPGVIRIIGIGQSLRGDDAAGLAAVRLWQETFQARVDRPHVQVEFAELPGLSLLDLLAGSRTAILVDAVRSGAVPGTVHAFTEEQLEAFTTSAGFVHGWSVAETLSLGRQLMPDSLPETLFLIGIDAGQLDIGQALSPEVASALPAAARMIEQLLGKLL